MPESRTRSRAKSMEALVGLALLALLAFAVSKAQSPREKPDGIEVNADFSSVEGLEVGSDVLLGGIKIGEITRIWLDELRPRVRMTVSEIFPEDSSASVQSAGLFGGKVLDIEPGGSPQNVTDGSTLLLTEGSIRLEDILDMVIARGKKAREER